MSAQESWNERARGLAAALRTSLRKSAGSGGRTCDNCGGSGFAIVRGDSDGLVCIVCVACLGHGMTGFDSPPLSDGG